MCSFTYVALLCGRLALGVVQGYDPDNDILMGNGSDDSSTTETLQLLVCVETSGTDGRRRSQGAPGGARPLAGCWIDPECMHLCQGTSLHLSLIGSVTANAYLI